MEKEKDEIIINPISHVLDKKFMMTLSSCDREKYVLKTTKKFNEIKSYILKNNLLA